MILGQRVVLSNLNGVNIVCICGSVRYMDAVWGAMPRYYVQVVAESNFKFEGKKREWKTEIYIRAGTSRCMKDGDEDEGGKKTIWMRCQSNGDALRWLGAVAVGPCHRVLVRKNLRLRIWIRMDTDGWWIMMNVISMNGHFGEKNMTRVLLVSQGTTYHRPDKGKIRSMNHWQTGIYL